MAKKQAMKAASTKTWNKGKSDTDRKPKPDSSRSRGWKESSDGEYQKFTSSTSIINPKNVIGFYKAGGPCEDFPCFSNFYWTGPYTFVFPKCVEQRYPFPASFTVYNSEQALMCIKAAMARDHETFEEMLMTQEAWKVKELQHGIKWPYRHFYKKHLSEIAFQIVLQKFEYFPKLKEQLLSTGKDILAEATENDTLWGIGINKGDPQVQDPKQWKGWNVLGMALMKVRAHFGGQDPHKVEEAMEALR